MRKSTTSWAICTQMRHLRRVAPSGTHEVRAGLAANVGDVHFLHLLDDESDAFKGCTRAEFRTDGLVVVWCTEEAVLAALLRRIFEASQGVDVLSSMRQRERLSRANMSPEELLRIPDRAPDGSPLQQVKTETGDIGEALSCLILIAYFGFTANELSAKNILRAVSRTSLHGIDVIGVSFVESAEALPLGDVLSGADRMVLVESKATGYGDQTFPKLLSAAKATNQGLDASRLWQELVVVENEFAQRDGNDSRSSKLVEFILEFANVTHRVQHHAHLHSGDTPQQDLEEAKSRTRFHTVVLSCVDIEVLQPLVFAYRRG